MSVTYWSSPFSQYISQREDSHIQNLDRNLNDHLFSVNKTESYQTKMIKANLKLPVAGNLIY